MNSALHPRELTEGQVAEELGIERLELYLAATHGKLGHYDALTHLMMFSDAEADALAKHLGVTRRRRDSAATAAMRAIPEPGGE